MIYHIEYTTKEHTEIYFVESRTRDAVLKALRVSLDEIDFIEQSTKEDAELLEQTIYSVDSFKH